MKILSNTTSKIHIFTSKIADFSCFFLKKIKLILNINNLLRITTMKKDFLASSSRLFSPSKLSYQSFAEIVTSSNAQFFVEYRQRCVEYDPEKEMLINQTTECK